MKVVVLALLVAASGAAGGTCVDGGAVVVVAEGSAGARVREPRSSPRRSARGLEPAAP
jgi:hypothetical protein